ncbi:dihydroxyacetone kinase phosphoryl donor subunit DhaM [Clostridium hydrogenum]|uniref:dihydroxyacetone kinase phosphoryl donor subunit DhaM n=1 Tax=Clostridium hydrogenum TaxID=2855764 RepID=UPI001F2B2AD2|nr:dihydroxyacetone kinase phosphoryl donor subunit DhaM [Clostridium hydrogenum]
MVGIVLVSHSQKLAVDLKELANEMASRCKVAAAGGTDDGRFGTDVKKIVDGINDVYSKDGVLILFDMGSAYTSAQMAVDFMDEDKMRNIEIVDTAFAEGTLTAAVEASIGKSKDEIVNSLKTMALNKIP